MKYAVVTGGANGIGRCIVDRFLKLGARVAVIDVDGEGLDRLKAQSQGVLCHVGDVGQKGDLEAFVAKIKAEFPQVDVLVNNACMSKKGIISGCSYDDFDYVLQVGVVAPYYLTLLLRDSFAPGASVVNISSTRQRMSQADTESYTAAKGGISALTHALAVSLAGRVRVNSISPGWIDVTHSAATPEDGTQHPAGRVGRPDDIADAVLFLCRSGFITGENITVDGGMTRLMVYHGDEGWEFTGNKE